MLYEESVWKILIPLRNVIHEINSSHRNEVGHLSVEENKALQVDKNFEVNRKLFHLAVVLLPIFHLLGISRLIILILFSILVFSSIPPDYYRRRHPEFFLNQFVRKSETGHMGSYIPIIIAGYLLYLFFGWRITTYALFVAAFGDAAAALVGIHYGKHRLPFTRKKTIEGLVGGFLAGLIVVILLNLFDTSGSYPLALLAPIIVVVTDFMEDPPHSLLSDNFLNPILCGVFFWIIGIPGALI